MGTGEPASEKILGDDYDKLPLEDGETADEPTLSDQEFIDDGTPSEQESPEKLGLDKLRVSSRTRFRPTAPLSPIKLRSRFALRSPVRYAPESPIEESSEEGDTPPATPPSSPPPRLGLLPRGDLPHPIPIERKVEFKSAAEVIPLPPSPSVSSTASTVVQELKEKIDIRDFDDEVVEMIKCFSCGRLNAARLPILCVCQREEEEAKRAMSGACQRCHANSIEDCDCTCEACDEEVWLCTCPPSDV